MNPSDHRRARPVGYSWLVIRRTNADIIIAALQSAGVLRLFGMPGGGSNADLIEAAGRAGLPFTLAHTETASAFMASAQAEITGKPGACLATLGPGAASVMNGVANAWLERIPLIVLTDCIGGTKFGHQNLRQGEMFGPVVKWTGRPGVGEVAPAIRASIEAATAFPSGPVHLDLSSEVTSGVSPGVTAAVVRRERLTRAMQVEARRAVVLAGLRARARRRFDLFARNFTFPRW